MYLACPGLSEYFHKRATIVASSPLIASVAAQQLVEHQLSRGLDAWERPAIYTIEAWLANCWQEARYKSLEIPSLLSASQELLLWQELIEQHHSNLFDIYATARLARRSAQWMAEWPIPSEGDAWNDHQDASQFQQWHKLLKARCLQENWITRADLWKLVPQRTAEGVLPSNEIVFIGFDIATPAFERIRQTLRATNLPFRHTANHPEAPSILQCSEFTQEIEEAARWARAGFELDPTTSIAVFVPNLAEHRALVERTFRNVFYPAAARHIAPPPDASLFHLNAAGPLFDHPLVATALLLLDLANPRIDLTAAGAILRSPFIKAAPLERDARALADLRLRSTRELDVSLYELEWASKECQHLKPIWSALRRLIQKKPSHEELAVWSEFMGDLLEAVGWPGDIELTSGEQEIVEAWGTALSGLASLGMVSAPVQYETALQHLRRLLSNPMPAVGDWSSPIQILEAAEAAGLAFDRAFLTGLSEENWPPRISLSPLIPLQLQRACRIPGSTPESYRIFAENSTSALFAAASIIAATYSDRLSPMAAPYVAPGDHSPRWQGKTPLQSYKPVNLECVTDTNAPPFHLTENSRGGTSILRAQSACPFRAFAEMRLQAQSPDEACFGFDARDRGAFLHKALEIVWKKIETQEQLRSLEPSELKELIQSSLEEAVKCHERDSEFHRQASNAERERLAEIILEWLALERERLQPFIVQTVEQERFFDVAGMRLSLRIDRIDQLPNGNLLLIDYKSGEQSRKKLIGDRPEEPQLLVYAAALGEQVEGIFFGQLKPRDLKAIGHSREAQFDSKEAEVHGAQWDSRVSIWRQTVERIGQQFVEGYAAVAPRFGACSYCNIKPLCRIQERLATSTEE
jgi:ATP-dependent helicase/nuclease subunit B